MTDIKIQGFDVNVNMRLWKVCAAAHLCGFTYNLVPLEYNVDNVKEEYIRNVHPLGRTPAIEVEGSTVFESASCMRYFARKAGAFYGSNELEQSQVDMWLDFAANECDKTGNFFIGKHLGVPVTIDAEVAAIEALNESLDGLEIWLEKRQFLVGDKLTIADVNLAFVLDWSFRLSPNHEVFTKAHPNVFRLYNAVMQHEKIIEVLKAHNAPTELADKKQ